MAQRLIDETGNRYGRWTVISAAGTRINSTRMALWLCRCDCGVEKAITGANLRRGKSKSCGCLKRKLFDETGNRYSRWTVISAAENNIYGQAFWVCRCDCGTEKAVLGVSLRRGKSKSCGCLQRERVSLPGQEAGFNVLLRNYRTGAERRGYSFNLSTEAFRTLIKGNCFYCGVPPSKIIGPLKPPKFNGIDRVDNTRGYEPGNCVSCCRVCNRAKRDMPLSEFSLWLMCISTHWHMVDTEIMSL